MKPEDTGPMKVKEGTKIVVTPYGRLLLEPPTAEAIEWAIKAIETKDDPCLDLD